jgi:hypothetical protein
MESNIGELGALFIPRRPSSGMGDGNTISDGIALAAFALLLDPSLMPGTIGQPIISASRPTKRRCDVARTC